MSPEVLEIALRDLVERPEMAAATAGATATEENLRTRLDLATARLANE
jgi:hypothetical protein